MHLDLHTIGAIALDYYQVAVKSDTFSFTGPGLALKGTMIPNHSVLERNTSVISTDDDALYCVTDRVTCCAGRGSDQADWFFPGTINELQPDATGRWYGGRLTGAVLMNYRSNGGNGITGLFRCEIRDSGGTLHKLYTCIYDSASATDCEFPALTHTLTNESVTYGVMVSVQYTGVGISLFSCCMPATKKWFI